MSSGGLKRANDERDIIYLKFSMHKTTSKVVINRGFCARLTYVYIYMVIIAVEQVTGVLMGFVK